MSDSAKMYKLLLGVSTSPTSLHIPNVSRRRLDTTAGTGTVQLSLCSECRSQGTRPDPKSFHWVQSDGTGLACSHFDTISDKTADADSCASLSKYTLVLQENEVPPDARYTEPRTRSYPFDEGACETFNGVIFENHEDRGMTGMYTLGKDGILRSKTITLEPNITRLFDDFNFRATLTTADGSRQG
ncbi:uncharacterized protein I303_102527 [Kwoniella dejecticola CBS 10117]|uniref:Uncharacterized protein n=1 Tax=Kwoniella dejecticola CBS 10117 TaxID=1296121 RepID=A0A1A6A8Z9_9TREE|nr:uncharacterized protein I303_02541 [Kwoniella dejecticola CBS 10117]OBR86533.1 hypothetical protein I303_02541 [Kwoniella dejecticola CBS 10117]